MIDLQKGALAPLKTVKEALDWVYTSYEKNALYFGHGTDNAWDEAVYLVCHVMELPYDSGEEILSLSVNEHQSQSISRLVHQRIDTRKPLAYLLNEAWFMGMCFYVDERVLVPRSPFAEWIANDFSPWVNKQAISRILEIGTGSGCMAIAAATQFPHAQVDAVDIDEQALKVAGINQKKHQVEDRVSFFQSDVFSQVLPSSYDIIMSNPPYVSSNEMRDLPEEYLTEPRHALETGLEGLEIPLRILSQAGDYLSPSGILIIEVGNNGEALQARLPRVPFVELEQAQGGHGLLLLSQTDVIAHQVDFDQALRK